MKLIHKDWTFEIIFEENTAQRMVLEEPGMFTSFVEEMNRWIEGQETGWLLSEQGKLLKASACCEMIIDYLRLDLNQRKLLSYLHSRLESEINDTELYISWQEMKSSLMELAERAIGGTGFDIMYEEPELKSVLKMLGVSFQKRSTTLLEALLEYQTLVSEVLGVRLFILVNAATYFTAEEIAYIYEQARYKKYYLLLIDTTSKMVDEDRENILIIDKDACIIQENL